MASLLVIEEQSLEEEHTHNLRVEEDQQGDRVEGEEDPGIGKGEVEGKGWSSISYQHIYLRATPPAAGPWMWTRDC